jgi:outer membrane protein OmpA-like peptidoglycan-associated protein
VSLSERRADRAKEFLISQGISADKIETRAEGENKQLAEKEVENLQSSNPVKPPEYMTRQPKATWLAHNRRVDIILEPTGKESARTYPNAAADARILWQRPTPSAKVVQAAH